MNEYRLPPPSLNCAEKFWARVPTSNTGCWEFKVAGKQAKYATFRHHGRMYRAHRIAWYLTNGTWPLVLDHLCRNRYCVRPDHLEPVTHKENILRGEGVGAKAARRTHCPKGHAYDLARKNGGRGCKTCLKLQTSEWYSRQPKHIWQQIVETVRCNRCGAEPRQNCITISGKRLCYRQTHGQRFSRATLIKAKQIPPDTIAAAIEKLAKESE